MRVTVTFLKTQGFGLVQACGAEVDIVANFAEEPAQVSSASAFSHVARGVVLTAV